MSSRGQSARAGADIRSLHASPGRATATAVARPRSRLRSERVLPILLVSPSVLTILVFVYVFIAITVYVSISNWNSLKLDLTRRSPPLATYGELFTTARFQADLRNVVIFTVLLLAASLIVGLALAILIDQRTVGYRVLRNAFLFPYALSFVVAGVVWRWIFNPEDGINVLFSTFGVNAALEQAGLAPLHPGWLTDPRVVLAVNDVLEQVFPGAGAIQVQLGIPLALIPVVIAATWQLSGFAMAMYLAGLGTISQEIREAARIDGAGEWEVSRSILVPLLKPFTVSALIILGHISLKIFDLIYAMSGTGPGFATDVPGLFVFDVTFKAGRFNLGAAASIVMLIMVAIVIVPYLARTLRER